MGARPSELREGRSRGALWPLGRHRAGPATHRTEDAAASDERRPEHIATGDPCAAHVPPLEDTLTPREGPQHGGQEAATGTLQLYTFRCGRRIAEAAFPRADSTGVGRAARASGRSRALEPGLGDTPVSKRLPQRSPAQVTGGQDKDRTTAREPPRPPHRGTGTTDRVPAPCAGPAVGAEGPEDTHAARLLPTSRRTCKSPPSFPQEPERD